MKLWVLSDMHVETRPAWQPQRPEDFDVLVVAATCP
jgi:predicted phosphodiesterase